jgi:hypothetical protein
MKNLTLLLLALCAASAALSVAAAPTRESFEPMVRELWDKQVREKGLLVFPGQGNHLCLSIPWHPVADSSSKSNRPMAWHMDFLPTSLQAPERQKQLRQLDALSKVGLLRKSRTFATVGADAKGVIRYEYTEEGWASSVQVERRWCFPYGTRTYLGVTRVAPAVVNARAGLEIYEVRAKAGVKSRSDLAVWARDEHLQTAFPEIQEQLAGKEYAVGFVRGSGGWVDLETLARDEATRRGSVPPSGPTLKVPQMPDPQAAARDPRNALPPPTIEEVKSAITRMNQVGEADPAPSNCIYLPGGERWPVDKKMYDYKTRRYAIAIFTNKDRKPHDPVVKRTIPYIEILEQLGILAARIERNLPADGKDSTSRYDAKVYELTPPFQHRTHARYLDCFPLGTASIKFIDVRLRDKHIPKAAFRYKIRVFYKQPPDWMKSPKLLDGWAELRDSIDRGRACEGEFEFDRTTRHEASGAGSCWWAFDNDYES